MSLHLRRENAHRDALVTEHGVTVADLHNNITMEESEKGDDACFFRYTV